MNISSLVFEQVLKQLRIPSHAIRQLQIAGKLSEVAGVGFPAELLQLSVPMMTRGLLNYAILQMKQDWLYPYWVKQQLDPKNLSFVARSQNPLLLNITHRNWTMLGSPAGVYEAIVDPRGLVTPLPREWSVDVWLISEKGVFLPSQQASSSQHYETTAPGIITQFQTEEFFLELEAFVDSTNHGRDVIFNAIHITNLQEIQSNIVVCIAVRPFNPEGVEPVQHIEFKNSRHIYVDKCLGIVFAEEPHWVICSNAENGDSVNVVRQLYIDGSWKNIAGMKGKYEISCPYGLANAVAAFKISFNNKERKSLHYSVALGKKKELNLLQPKSTWRVSFDKRREHHKTQWQKERAAGATVTLADERWQKIFDANVLALLQLHDGKFISPGPYLYHRFWFRDAAPMLHALGRLGFHKRVRQVIDSFPERQTSSGFFQGPDGEWDSNGEALWIIEQHAKTALSFSWLKHYFSTIERGAEWILQKRRAGKDTKTTHYGLLPPSLSAEHFGTVGQYYWDSLWGLAGIRSAAELARVMRQEEAAVRWESEAKMFAGDIRRSIEKAAVRLGREVIPASPSRPFDESAVGFVCGIYPLGLEDIYPSAFKTTLDEFTNRYIDEKGFYHPIVHSGYNAYLTLQLAHAFLLHNEHQRAWHIANTIFRQCVSPFSLPEAIHPKTGGGAMGDGHHGWAAAEIVLFLLDCFVKEQGDILFIFKDIQPEMLQWGIESSVQGAATSFGTVGCALKYETAEKAFCMFTIVPSSGKNPSIVEISLPFTLRRVLSVSDKGDIDVKYGKEKTIVRFSPCNVVLLLEQ